MSFFKRQDIGRLYVLKMVLKDNSVVYKIGMCNSSRSTDRMMEILRSWFMYYRYVPYTELKLDKETTQPVVIEKHIHNILKPRRYTPTHDVEGSTEMFKDIDEFRVLHYLRSCKDEMFEHPLDLSETDYKNLSLYLSP